ncbi:hypothetical protein [Aureimonas endophytica]|nr:hypothetical protein [Aureimonas endophytica]
MIVGFGSVDPDLATAAACIPQPGKTLIGRGSSTVPGGKESLSGARRPR